MGDSGSQLTPTRGTTALGHTGWPELSWLPPWVYCEGWLCISKHARSVEFSYLPKWLLCPPHSITLAVFNQHSRALMRQSSPEWTQGQNLFNRWYNWLSSEIQLNAKRISPVLAFHCTSFQEKKKKKKEYSSFILINSAKRKSSSSSEQNSHLSCSSFPFWCHSVESVIHWAMSREEPVLIWDPNI